MWLDFNKMFALLTQSSRVFTDVTLHISEDMWQSANASTRLILAIMLQSKNLCSLWQHVTVTVLPFMLFNYLSTTILRKNTAAHWENTVDADAQCFASLLLWSFTQLISERLELLICFLEPFSRNCEFKVSRRLSDCDRPDSTLWTLALRCVPCPVSLLTAASRRGLDVETETCENTCCSSDDCTLHMCRTADT